MSAQARSGSSGITGFFLGLIVAALIAVGLMAWPMAAREPPLRTVELSLPTPEIPMPPGTIPDAADVQPPAP